MYVNAQASTCSHVADLSDYIRVQIPVYVRFPALL